MSRLFCSALALAAAALPATAGAQLLAPTVEFDFDVAYYAFIDRGGFGEGDTVSLENLRDSVALTPRFGVNFASWIGFEATFTLVPTSTWDTYRRAFYMKNHYDLVLQMPTPVVAPYAAVGAGFQYYNISSTLSKGQGAVYDRPVRDPYPNGEVVDGEQQYREQDQPYTYRSWDGDFIIDAGGGAKFQLHPHIGLRFDIRWVFSIGPGGEDDGVPTLEEPPEWNDRFQHLEFGGGVYVLLGGPSLLDKDLDGISNRLDACKDEAEDKDGFEDEDGCPDPDNDNDGVPDEDDQCRDEAEDRDGTEDGDGCPDLDNDGDGITDDQDECPSKAEDEDGFEDRDGCPELDNDGDGFLDADDACINNPENFNSYLDRDGCPDQIPGDLVEFAGAIPAVQFKAGSAQLLKSAFDVLNRAAAALTRYPDLKVEVQGHASSEGDDDYNMELSQQRVETVREYLINRGVDPGRVVARGYGETKPVADNDTEEGRRKNRRVEFKLFN